MCEAMDAELLLGYLKWIRLDSAGSIRLMEGFNSQFGYKIIWIRKNIFHRHLLNRLTNGRGKLLHEVPVKTPGDFPFIKVWIGEISRSNLCPPSDTFPEFGKDSENRAEAYSSLSRAKFYPA